MRDHIKSLFGNRNLTSFGARFLAPRVAVLAYHDLGADDDYSSWMKVPVSAFDEQLSSLMEIGDFITPGDLFRPEKLSRERMSFLVTFDDGYVNNFRLALPLLEKRGIPALFFISTAHLRTGGLFWPDRIIAPLQLHDLNSIDLTDFGLREYEFPRTGVARRWESIDRLLTDMKSLGNTTDESVSNILHYFDSRFMGSLSVISKQSRPMNPEELTEAGKSGFVTIGSHSHRHDILTYLDDADLESNLRESRRILEQLTGRPVIHISYPNGNTDARVREYSTKAGYRFGFLTEAGLVDQRCRRLDVPRITIGGYDSVEVIRYKINRTYFNAAFNR